MVCVTQASADVMEKPGDLEPSLPNFDEKERPSIDLFKAIFEEGEDEEEEEEEEEEKEEESIGERCVTC